MFWKMTLCVQTKGKLTQINLKTSLYQDNIKAKVLIKIATDDIANDLICDMNSAKEMKKTLDTEFKLGDKDYDLDFLTNQFEEASLDIKTNPSVYFTNLNKINKKFCKFTESGGKDYTRDDMEMYIKICKSVASDYKEVVMSYKTNHVKTVDPKVKLTGLKEALKEFWKENHSHLYQSDEKSNMILNTNTVKKCTYCGKEGHEEHECWKKHGKFNSSKSDKKRKCWICGSTDHVKKSALKEKEIW